MLKLTYPTAFTVSLLSWAYWEFKQGYAASDNLEFGANTIRWGADYLNTVAITNITSSSGTVQPIFVVQVWRADVIIIIIYMSAMCLLTYGAM